jgi:hypothetical protein
LACSGANNGDIILKGKVWWGGGHMENRRQRIVLKYTVLQSEVLLITVMTKWQVLRLWTEKRASGYEG